MNLPARPVSQDKTISVPVERAVDHRRFRPGMIDVSRMGGGSDELYALSLRTLSMRTIAHTMAVRPDNTLLDRGKDVRFEITEHATIELTREQTFRLAAELARALGGEGLPAIALPPEQPGGTLALALPQGPASVSNAHPAERPSGISLLEGGLGPVSAVTAAAAAAVRAATDPALPPARATNDRVQAPPADQAIAVPGRAEEATLPAPRRAFGRAGTGRAATQAPAPQALPAAPPVAPPADPLEEAIPYPYPSAGRRFGGRSALLATVAVLLAGGSVASAWYVSTALMGMTAPDQAVAERSAAGVRPAAGVEPDTVPASQDAESQPAATAGDRAALPLSAAELPGAARPTGPAAVVALIPDTPVPVAAAMPFAAEAPPARPEAVADAQVAPLPARQGASMPASFTPPDPVWSAPPVQGPAASAAAASSQAAPQFGTAPVAFLPPAGTTPIPLAPQDGTPFSMPAPSAGTAPALAAAQTGTTPSLVVRARTDTWVQVRDSRGEVLIARVLRAGEQWTPPAQPGLRMTTGNAGGTEIVLNGATLPPLGPVGQVRRDVPLDPQRL